MLRYMRENTGSWIIKILLGLVILVFIFLGMGSKGSKRGTRAAMVDDETITMAEYQRSYDSVVEQMRRMFGKQVDAKMLKMLQAKKQAINRLIDQRLLLKEADRLKINVSDKELQDSLLSIPAFRRDGVFDLVTYKRVLAGNRLTPEMFEADQKQSLKQEKIRNLVLWNIFASDMEAGEWYRYKNTKFSIDYISFKPLSYTKIDPDNRQIHSYYDKNKNHYKSEPMLEVEYLKFSPDDYRKKVSIPASVAKEYYNENMDKFKVPAMVEARHILIRVAPDASEAAVKQSKQKAEKIYKMVLKGENFSLLAKKFSEGPSKKSGGYLGKFTRNSMVKPFADKAFSMKKGEISKPVRTRFGWHIIKVEGVYPASTKPFKEAKPSIVKTLEDNKIKNLAYDDAGKAFDAIIDGEALKEAAAAAGKQLRDVGPFTKTGNGLLMPAAAQFAKAAFSLPLNEISDIKEIQGNYYIIKPMKKIAPSVLDFEKVKGKVKQDLVAELQQKMAAKDAEKFLSALKKDGDIHKLAAKKGLKIKSSKLFTRDAGIAEIAGNRKITSAAFKLSPKNRFFSNVLKANGNYYIIAFKDKKVPDQVEIDKNMDKAKKELLKIKRNKTFTAFLDTLRMKSKIKIEPGLMD